MLSCAVWLMMQFGDDAGKNHIIMIKGSFSSDVTSFSDESDPLQIQ